MEDLNLIGLAVAAAWLLCGFYAAGFMENRASREQIPAKLFPYLVMAALLLGPVVPALAYLLKLLSGGPLRQLRDKLERNSRIAIEIFDARGKEMYGPGSDETGAVVEFKKMLGEALKRRADDIFIDPRGGGVRQVRIRVDGALQQLSELQPPLGEELVNVIKIVSGMDVAEKQRPQNGSFNVSGGEFGRIALNVAGAGALGGEKLAIRLLRTETGPRTLEDAGLYGTQLQLMQDAVRLPSGLVLICGPSGSGRTTTLCALLRAIDYRTKNVISIEEHVENVMEEVSQMEVNEQSGITFGKLLDNALQQNPDIICLGEIRDRETATGAVRAAQTGHLIIATICGRDNADAIGRMAELGVPPSELARPLRMIVSQRLIRKLCDCAEPTSPSPELTEYLQAAGLPTDGIRRPVGCRKCDGSGYAGRRAIFDIVTVSDGLRALLGNGQTTVDDIRAGIESEYGASILAYEGYKLAAAGITSVEEVERVAFDMEKAD